MDDTSFKLLKLYATRNTISLSGLSAIYNTHNDYWISPVRYLIEKEYLRINPEYVLLHNNDFTITAPIEITYEGKLALEQERKERQVFKFNEFRAWFTLIIAVIALVMSISK